MTTDTLGFCHSSNVTYCQEHNHDQNQKDDPTMKVYNPNSLSGFSSKIRDPKISTLKSGHFDSNGNPVLTILMRDLLEEVERVTSTWINDDTPINEIQKYKAHFDKIVPELAYNLTHSTPNLGLIVHHILSLKQGTELSELIRWILVFIPHNRNVNGLFTNKTTDELESIIHLLIQKMGVSKASEFIEHVIATGPVDTATWYEIIADWNEHSAAYPVEWLVDIARTN